MSREMLREAADALAVFRCKSKGLARDDLDCICRYMDGRVSRRCPNYKARATLARIEAALKEEGNG